MNDHNLKPFQKGNKSGKGRPRGVQNSSTRLLRFLKLKQQKKNPITGKEEKFTIAEQMDLIIISKALKGDVIAYREIFDRFEGKVRQNVELTGLDGGAVQIIQIPDNGRNKDNRTPTGLPDQGAQ